MPTIEYYDFDLREIRTIELRYRRDERMPDRWNVRRADNDRLLGWVYPPRAGNDKAWTAHVASGAFRGDDVNDEGDILDHVPAYLYNGSEAETFKCPTITRSGSRYDAVIELLSWLLRKHAPAMGYGRHFEVRRYDTAERREAAQAQR